MLIGEYNYNLDPKGRINFPAKLREDLGEQFVVCKALTDHCLNVYSLDAWERLKTKIDSLPIAKGRNIVRHVFAGADVVVPDKQGRISIISKLREYAKLDKEVVIIGVSDHCEIWDQAEWEKVCAAVDQEDILKDLEDLGF